MLPIYICIVIRIFLFTKKSKYSAGHVLLVNYHLDFCIYHIFPNPSDRRTTMCFCITGIFTDISNVAIICQFIGRTPCVLLPPIRSPLSGEKHQDDVFHHHQKVFHHHDDIFHRHDDIFHHHHAFLSSWHFWKVYKIFHHDDDINSGWWWWWRRCPSMIMMMIMLMWKDLSKSVLHPSHPVTSELDSSWCNWV